MAAASMNANTTLLASSPLRPYAHQANAVYGAMLPQPFLRFLLADEPGTGKTIMAGLYLREMQRLGLIRRALVVVPANLVGKWQSDFDRFFGGGLRRITADTVREHGLDTGHDLWVVSLELAAINGAVQDAIRPDKAGWDIVVFDEAHRLTPSAGSFHQVGRMLARNTPRALLMTATPHRGSEWLFRHLLHLVDPDIYPDPGGKEDNGLQPLRPGSVHFLRRMKEDLVDYDGVTRLFRGRTAENFRVPLGSKEYSIYQQALDMVDQFFPTSARSLARMVYGKRAASSLYGLRS
jgi:SNF2 family DNA or RNA helicase